MECSFQTHVNCDQILSPAIDSTGKLLAINLMSVYTVSQNYKHVGMRKSGHSGDNVGSSGSCCVKQLFIPLKRKDQLYAWNQSVLGTMMIVTSRLTTVWTNRTLKFCIFWSSCFSIERGSTCKFLWSVDILGNRRRYTRP